MRKKILIIEDDADIRKLIHVNLPFEEFDIFEAGDGQEGWVLAQEIERYNETPHEALRIQT